jgi:hypothetical protein
VFAERHGSRSSDSSAAFSQQPYMLLRLVSLGVVLEALHQTLPVFTAPFSVDRFDSCLQREESCS